MSRVSTIPTSVRTHLFMPQNPLLRLMTHFSRGCSKCGRRYLKVALDDLIRDKRFAFSLSDKLISSNPNIMDITTELGYETFNVERNQTKEALKVLYFKKGSLEMLSSIGGYSHCEYTYICRGCRAGEYAYYRDCLTPDPRCIRELEESSTLFALKTEAEHEPTLIYSTVK
ncbi:MAG: hypothetical protein QXI71_03300 [Candidatus Bathyarchaeia archaeon]|nr:hypothetical protein [Candidatus Bathyarchaeota archaeon]